jgi:microcystin-dependent protein
MSTPFIGEIKIMSFGFPPKGWAQCDGQILAINQNQALFSLLGTTYGGNGQTTFALPNLKGSAPMHFGAGHTLGEVGGEEAHTLSVNEMAAHVHPSNGTTTGVNSTKPNNNLFGTTASPIYAAPNHLVGIGPATIGSTGGGQAHENRQPLLVLNFCIALVGIFPSRN